MPVPGYDPDEVESALETRLREADVSDVLSDEERDAYENDDAPLIDLLDDDQIERLLDEY